MPAGVYRLPCLTTRRLSYLLNHVVYSLYIRYESLCFIYHLCRSSVPVSYFKHRVLTIT
jgi:hypothetical protein